MIALVVCLFILFPKDAIGANSHDERLANAQELLKRPELAYKGAKDFSQPQGWGCVGGLRNNGFYVPMSPTRTAGGILVDSTELPPEGEYVVVVTNEGWAGHVALAANVGGRLIVRMEFNYSKHGGKGREIPLSRYKGYNKSKKEVTDHGKRLSQEPSSKAVESEVSPDSSGSGSDSGTGIGLESNDNDSVASSLVRGSGGS